MTDAHDISGSSFVYTIGHSNHPIEKFLDLLEEHRIEVLVDTFSPVFQVRAALQRPRSKGVSRMQPGYICVADIGPTIHVGRAPELEDHLFEVEGA